MHFNAAPHIKKLGEFILHLEKKTLNATSSHCPCFSNMPSDNKLSRVSPQQWTLLCEVSAVVASCVLAFLKARVWVTHIWCQSVEREQWSVEGAFCVASGKGSSRYGLFISRQTWPRATSSTLLWGAFDFWRKEGDTPSLTQSLPCTPQWVFSLLITHSFPPCTQSYVHGPVSQVTCLHSLAYIQHGILYMALFESVQWFITKPWRCNKKKLLLRYGLSPGYQ